MTGFIRGLLGGKKAKNPGESDRPVPQAPIQRAEGAFFLEPDDAKSFGNIDYMRSSKTVRRTFAKKVGETEEKASIRQISALEAIRLQENGLPPIKPTAAAQPVAEPTVNKQPSFDRRKVDTNLDMFRKMAKEMKK